MAKNNWDSFASSVSVRMGGMGRNTKNPAVIISIISAILPIITECWSKKENISSDAVAARLRESHERNAARTRNSLATALRTQGRKEGRRRAKASGIPYDAGQWELTKEESLEAADKTIQEALSSTSAKITTLING